MLGPVLEPDANNEVGIPAVRVETAQQMLTDRVMSIPGVVGTAIGTAGGAPCIKVLVVVRTDAVEAAVPATFHGYPVVVEESGRVDAR